MMPSQDLMFVKIESIYKPCFVLRFNRMCDHSPGSDVAIRFTQPTRSSNDASHISELTRSCTGWGLQAPGIAIGTGGLLHHPFTLTPTSGAVYFLLHFPCPRGLLPLEGILLCGARTFLPKDFTLLRAITRSTQFSKRIIEENS